MSAEIVNLRRVRKAQARTDREAQAAENRARHGRSKVMHAAEALEADRAGRVLDGARREPPATDDAG